MKFEEAFNSKTGKLVTIQKIATIYKHDPKLYKSNFHDNLYCPECRQAKLIYVNDNSPYYRTSPNSVHKLDCSLAQDIMTQKQAKAYIEDPKNKDKIVRQLETILHSCLKGASSITGLLHKYPKTPVKCTEDNCTQNIQISKYLSRKRIDNYNSVHSNPDDFIDKLKIFYGIVYIKWLKIKKAENYYLFLRSQKTSKLLCRISVSSKVYKHITKSIGTPTDGLYYIAFLAEFSSQYNQRAIKQMKNAYLNTTLRYSYYLNLLPV